MRGRGTIRDRKVETIGRSLSPKGRNSSRNAGYQDTKSATRKLSQFSTSALIKGVIPHEEADIQYPFNATDSVSNTLKLKADYIANLLLLRWTKSEIQSIPTRPPPAPEPPASDISDIETSSEEQQPRSSSQGTRNPTPTSIHWRRCQELQDLERVNEAESIARRLQLLREPLEKYKKSNIESVPWERIPLGDKSVRSVDVKRSSTDEGSDSRGLSHPSDDGGEIQSYIKKAKEENRRPRSKKKARNTFRHPQDQSEDKKFTNVPLSKPPRGGTDNQGSEHVAIADTDNRFPSHDPHRNVDRGAQRQGQWPPEQLHPSQLPYPYYISPAPYSYPVQERVLQPAAIPIPPPVPPSKQYPEPSLVSLPAGVPSAPPARPVPLFNPQSTSTHELSNDAKRTAPPKNNNEESATDKAFATLERLMGLLERPHAQMAALELKHRQLEEEMRTKAAVEQAKQQANAAAEAEANAKPITLQDCLGRRFTFPLEMCRSWSVSQSLSFCDS